MRFPESSVALIDELDRMFPERVPEATDTMEMIQRQAGKRELILFLKHWRDEQKRAAAREDKRLSVRR